MDWTNKYTIYTIHRLQREKSSRYTMTRNTYNSSKSRYLHPLLLQFLRLYAHEKESRLRIRTQCASTLIVSTVRKTVLSSRTCTNSAGCTRVDLWRQQGNCARRPQTLLSTGQADSIMPSEVKQADFATSTILSWPFSRCSSASLLD